MSDEIIQGKGKKPYTPPQLVVISLRPEEAVLGACKVSGTGGAVSPSSCTSLVQPCSSLGS